MIIDRASATNTLFHNRNKKKYQCLFFFNVRLWHNIHGVEIPVSFFYDGTWGNTGNNSFCVTQFFKFPFPLNFSNMRNGRKISSFLTLLLFIWSHPVWKYRIGIFGHRVAKTCKKPWRETFGCTIGAKFWRKILLPGQNFQILPFWSEVPRWHSAECRVPLRHLEHQWCAKFLSRIF